MRYRVTDGNGARIALFYGAQGAAAMRFARQLSIDTGAADVDDMNRTRGGIVGQFRNGKSTPEFAHNDRPGFADLPADLEAAP